MARLSRFGGFGFQVRLVLVLLVLFLVTLDLMNLWLLGETRDGLLRSEEDRVALLSQGALQSLGKANLALELSEPRPRTIPTLSFSSRK